jgi:glyoxylase-like metal-dependent hydrolase (beta-lactamase superfamily II)
MMRPVADGVLVSTSEFMQTNTVVVQGSSGVLLVDPGIREDELVAIARQLRERDQRVTAGFSTHPHWDHLLWHADLGDAPRYGTPGCAAVVQARLSGDNWRDVVVPMIPPDLVDDVPLDQTFARVTALPEGTTEVPWDAGRVRLIEHAAHAPGHAALLIEDRSVLVAGDMLSDVLIPILNGFAADPVGEYLAALQVLEEVASDVDVVIPGHGSVADAAEFRARLDRDRAYVTSLREGGVLDDPRVQPSAPYGAAMSGVDERQRQQLAR